MAASLKFDEGGSFDSRLVPAVRGIPWKREGRLLCELIKPPCRRQGGLITYQEGGYER